MMYRVFRSGTLLSLFIPVFLSVVSIPTFAADTIVHQIALPAGMSWCDDTMINGLLTQVNAYRTQNSVPPLRMDSLGMKDAELRATQFANYMATHTPGATGFNPHEGYDTTAASLGYDLVSENLAYMTSNPYNIVFSVWQDPLHRAAMLAADANVAGVSCVYSNATPYWTYEPGVGASPTPSTSLDTEESAFLTLINSYRAQNGAGPLQISPTLLQSSSWMSTDMATKNYVSHTDSLGRSLGTRLAAFGYTFAPYGENLAAGYADAQSVFNGWMNACDPDSTGACTYAHRKNMLNPNYNAIGIGRAYSASSAYGWYWTTDFGGVVDSSTPAPSVPVISSFSASPASIAAGQASTLIWSVSGATSVTIDNGVGDVSSLPSKTVFPAATTTYRLTATNASGSVSATATVTVTTATKDATPPSPPVLASAVATSSSQVALAWGASTDNVGVTGYQVLRNGSPVATVGGSTLAYTDSAAAAGAVYTYAVRAFDASSNYSASSNSLSVTIPALPPPPSSSCPGPALDAFTGCYFNNLSLTGSPTLVRTDNQINFDWAATVPDKSLSASGYSVRWQGNIPFAAGTYAFTATMSDGMRLYVDGYPLINVWRDQGAYTYTARRILTAGTHLLTLEYYERTGTATAHLSWQQVVSTTPAPVISFFSATPGSIQSGQGATLSWSVSGATATSIDNGVGTVSGLSSKQVFPASTTTYTLTASNSGGSTTAKVTVSVAVITGGTDTQPPTAPVLASAIVAGPTAVALAWNASADNVGVTGYQVLRNGVRLTTVPGSTLTYTDASAAANTTYTYAIRAVDAAGNLSPASNTKTVATPVASGGSCAPAINAFTGCYYSNTDLAGTSALVRTDPQINFDWLYSSPSPSLPATNYSVRWKGNFSFDQGNYGFYLTATDGMRVYIDNALVFERWADEPLFTSRVLRSLTQGVHLITVEYYSRTGNASAHLSWVKY